MNRKRSCGHCENIEDPKGKTTESRSHVPPAKRWEILARALWDRGYAIIPEGGGQKIVRIRTRKNGISVSRTVRREMGRKGSEKRNFALSLSKEFPENSKRKIGGSPAGKRSERDMNDSTWRKS